MSSWSQKYKQSIDCDNPKGFSQKAHCAGKKKSFKEMREYVRGFGTYPGDTMKPMASLGGAQFFPNKRYATTMPAMSASYKGAGHGTIKPMVTADTKRIPRKPGQKAKSDKHSDLYTDEDPKGTIRGLKFATVADAQRSIRKIKNSTRKHNHKTQAAIAMEQRAKVAGKHKAALVYRRFIEQQKRKTKNRKA